MEVRPTHRSITVKDASQPSTARYAARDAAAFLGLSEEDAYRVGLVATELATNLVKHASGGEFLVCGRRSDSDREVEMLAVDRGPGMRDVHLSLSDGHSTAGTPGNGLGAVQRLADSFDIYSQAGRGTVVLATVRMRRAPAAERRAFQVRGVSVAKHGETLCGDAWQWAAEPDAISLILVDGLGHGLQAHQAATAAIGVVAPGRSSAAVELIQQMHAGIRHTRGAAAAVARIDRRAATVTYAGIGNISASIVKSTAVRHAVSLNGTLGHEVRAFREYTYPWDQQSTIVMHSDGLGSHWALDAYPGLRQHDPLVAAALLYRDFSRERDDVTVVVGREVT